jgi:hypothetical protein
MNRREERGKSAMGYPLLLATLMDRREDRG